MSGPGGRHPAHAGELNEAERTERPFAMHAKADGVSGGKATKTPDRPNAVETLVVNPLKKSSFAACSYLELGPCLLVCGHGDRNQHSTWVMCGDVDAKGIPVAQFESEGRPGPARRVAGPAQRDIPTFIHPPWCWNRLGGIFIAPGDGAVDSGDDQAARNGQQP